VQKKIVVLEDISKFMPLIATIIIVITAFIGGGVITNIAQNNPTIKQLFKNGIYSVPTPTTFPYNCYFGEKAHFVDSEQKCKEMVIDYNNKNPTPTNKVNQDLIPTSDPDPIVNCNINIHCGGGSQLLRNSICDNSICCEIGEKSYFYQDKSKCFLDQLIHNNATVLQQTSQLRQNINPTITNTPIPTQDLRQRDSYGNLCSSYLSHCKYKCSIKDDDIDYRINTIRIHNDQLETCKSSIGANCSIWENALKTDFTSLIQYCGSDFLNYL
jgi:hypothetical protein